MSDTGSDDLPELDSLEDTDAVPLHEAGLDPASWPQPPSGWAENVYDEIEVVPTDEPDEDT